MNWVYTAYGITWAILIAYLLVLTLGFQRVRDDVADLERR
jgi:uncharacterized membrane protein YdjX (TVP38/TMEM64 family)